MNIAAQARAAAIQLEVKKDGLQQRQSGDWTLRFVAQGIDMDSKLMAAPMGTRYVCVLVEVADDETPVKREEEPAHQHVSAAQPRPVETDKPRPGGRKFDELSAAQQAGILCGDPAFWVYLVEVHGYNPRDTDEAAEAVRDICGVVSRTLLHQEPAATLWRSLVLEYRTWQREPAVLG